MEECYEWVNRGYGKNNVKLLYVRREGVIHSITEYDVSTELTLDSDDDYIHGDNSAIVATDSQKNTVYILAKHHGVSRCMLIIYVLHTKLFTLRYLNSINLVSLV